MEVLAGRAASRIGIRTHDTEAGSERRESSSWPDRLKTVCAPEPCDALCLALSPTRTPSLGPKGTTRFRGRLKCLYDSTTKLSDASWQGVVATRLRGSPRTVASQFR